MKNFSKSSIFFLFLLATLVWGGGGETLAQINQCYNTPWNVEPPNNNIGIHTDEPEKPLHIYAWPNICNDPAIKLSAGQPEYAGYLSLLTGPDIPNNLDLYTMILNRSIGDLVLSTDKNANDLILTTRNSLGNIRFATTPVAEEPDFERMTITALGKVGISNPEPKNLFSTKITTGLDFWNDNLEFQDVRFNCYGSDGRRDGGSPLDTSSRDDRDQCHKNVLPGHASIIQSKSSSVQGGLLILVSQKYENPDSHIEFFDWAFPEPSQPKGILLQNYQCSEINVTNIGLGSLTDPDSRVKIRGRTTDDNMNALKVVDWGNNPLFLVRNDGYISIGTEIYTEELPQEMNYRFSVDGQLVAKDIIVTLADWSDFVFEDGYKLQSLEEVEQYIKENKHLSEIPSAADVESNGVNIGEMQVSLLKKIEELTLYVIQLKKENDGLNKRLSKIELENNEAGGK